MCVNDLLGSSGADQPDTNSEPPLASWPDTGRLGKEGYQTRARMGMKKASHILVFLSVPEFREAFQSRHKFGPQPDLSWRAVGPVRVDGRAGVGNH